MEKGSILDLFFIVALCFAIAISFVVGYYLTGQVKEGFATIPATANLTNTSFDYGLNAFSLFDSGFVIIFIGLALGTIISAFFIRSHPVFFVINIIILVMVLIFTGVMSNVYTLLFTNNALTTSASHFSATATLMDNLPYVVVGIFILLSIVVFGKASLNQSGGNV